MIGKKYMYKGKLYTLRELAKISPVKAMTDQNLYSRIVMQKWPVNLAVEKPLLYKPCRHQYVYNGKHYTTKQLAAHLGYDVRSISRIAKLINQRNLPFEEQLKLYKQGNYDRESKHNKVAKKITTKQNGQHHQMIMYQNQMYTIIELAHKFNMSGHILNDRLNKKHWTLSNALHMPLDNHEKMLMSVNQCNGKLKQEIVKTVKNKNVKPLISTQTEINKTANQVSTNQHKEVTAPVVTNYAKTQTKSPLQYSQIKIFTDTDLNVLAQQVNDFLAENNIINPTTNLKVLLNNQYAMTIIYNKD